MNTSNQRKRFFITSGMLCDSLNRIYNPVVHLYDYPTAPYMPAKSDRRDCRYHLYAVVAHMHHYYRSRFARVERFACD